MELCAGVPANWIVLVVGTIADWAFAEKVANAMKTAKPNKTAADFSRKTDLPGANVTAVIEGLTLAFPSRKPWLPGSFADVLKKASSNCPGTIYIRKCRKTSVWRILASLFTPLTASILISSLVGLLTPITSVQSSLAGHSINRGMNTGRKYISLRS